MQLSSYEKNIKENIIFNKSKEYKVKDSKIKYKRIPIEVRYSNSQKGPLVVETPFLFSFGVSENKDRKTGKLVGYSIPVCLWKKDSKPNDKEKKFFDFINMLITLSKKHLDNEYEPDQIKSLSSPFYYKKIEYTDKKGNKKTKVDNSSSPILYTKLIYSEKTKKILSLFKGKKGCDLNPLKYINQYCWVKLALIFEGIFISNTVTSLQIKVHECYIKDIEEPRKSLIKINEKDSDDDDLVVEDLILSDE